MSSRWSDYGFPDIAGVHVQTALEGLVAALDERTYAVTGAPYTYTKPVVSPIQDVMRLVENNFNWLSTLYSHLFTFVLPDGTMYSPSNAASYLGEALIELPFFPTSQGYDWSDPFPAIGYDWIMQRYRMLNLMYRARYDSLREILYGWSRYGGAGNTIAKAMEDANNRWVEEIHYNTMTTDSFQAGITIETWDDPATGFPYSATMYISLPKMLLYPLYVPSVLTLEGTARAPENGTFDSFGTGLTEGENVRPVTLPADVAYQTPVDFDTSAPVANFRSTVPASAGKIGFSFPSYFFADIRPSLEFYDPIEGV